MSYDPRIAALRRRAKSRSRATGESYQATLDEVAREEGAADWADYLSNPLDIGQYGADTPPPPGRHQAHWKTQAKCAAVTLLAIAITSLMSGIEAAHAVNAVRQKMIDVEADRIGSTNVRFRAEERDMPVTSLVRLGGRLEMTVMVADDRIFSIKQRRAMPASRGGRDAIGKAAIEHPVVRLAGDVNCVDGTFRPTRMEMADGYRDRAAYAHSLGPRSRTRRLAQGDLERICGTTGQGDVTKEIASN